VILVDTSVWIDHLRAGNVVLERLLNSAAVLGDPFVIGELALGNLRQRNVVLGALRQLPQAVAPPMMKFSFSSETRGCSAAASGISTRICWQPRG
jgi:predicted nucleic acid-binding protein